MSMFLPNTDSDNSNIKTSKSIPRRRGWGGDPSASDLKPAKGVRPLGVAARQCAGPIRRGSRASTSLEVSVDHGSYRVPNGAMIPAALGSPFSASRWRRRSTSAERFSYNAYKVLNTSVSSSLASSTKACCRRSIVSSHSRLTSSIRVSALEGLMPPPSLCWFNLGLNTASRYLLWRRYW